MGLAGPAPIKFNHEPGKKRKLLLLLESPSPFHAVNVELLPWQLSSFLSGMAGVLS